MTLGSIIVLRLRLVICLATRDGAFVKMPAIVICYLGEQVAGNAISETKENYNLRQQIQQFFFLRKVLI